jgi:hypothetical protein
LIVCAKETTKSQSKPYKKIAKTQNQKSHPTPQLDCQPKKTPNPRNHSFMKLVHGRQPVVVLEVREIKGLLLLLSSRLPF